MANNLKNTRPLKLKRLNIANYTSLYSLIGHIGLSGYILKRLSQ